MRSFVSPSLSRRVCGTRASQVVRFFPSFSRSRFRARAHSVSLSPLSLRSTWVRLSSPPEISFSNLHADVSTVIGIDIAPARERNVADAADDDAFYAS